VNGLSHSEKQFLIDATQYHQLYVEHRLLRELEALIQRYPRTHHPLIVGKLPKAKRDDKDDQAIESYLNSRQELREFLTDRSFLLPARLKFVSNAIDRARKPITNLLVTCDRCDRQYAVLPFEYYLQSG
jgi:hypothetical protein